MAYHVTYIWSQQGDRIGGWTESFWHNADSLDGARAAAFVMLPKMVAIRGVEASCPAIHITSVPDIPVLGGSRLGRPFPTGYRPITALTGTADTSADYQSVAYQINLSAGGTGTIPSFGPHNRTQWLRGIIDANIVEGGKYVAQAATQAPLTALFTHLQTEAFGWRLRINNPAMDRKPITDGFPEPGRLEVVGHGIPDGVVRQVRISGIEEPTQFNGLQWVFRVDDDTVQIQGWKSPGPVPFRGRGAWMRRQEFTLLPITQAGVVRASSHYTGRPLGQLGGRRQRRRS